MKAGRTLLLVVLAVPIGGLAQTPPDLPRHSGTVETAILELDVVVTDKSGKPITGLGPTDFEVRLGGRPAPITNFSEHRRAASGSSTLAAAATSPEPREAEREAREGRAASDSLVASVRPPRHVVFFLDRLQLPDKSDSTATRGATASFAAFVARAGADGSFSDVMMQKGALEVPAERLALAREGHLTYRLPVLLGPGDARLSVAVLDSVGQEAGFLLVEVAGSEVRVRR